ncbi:MAG: type II toxin-antitoxin system HicB family antitoxin [Actinomycetota bacterium]
MTAYPINIFWSEEDSQWIAVVPDLEGCSASGDSPEEAAREIQIAMKLWLDVANENGDPIPQPSAPKAV